LTFFTDFFGRFSRKKTKKREREREKGVSGEGMELFLGEEWG
jgi:hypothetical protein